MAEVVSKDIFGALFSLLMGFLVYYMISDRCASMTQYCVLTFGLICCLESLFETIGLIMMLQGRQTRHTQADEVRSGKTTSVTYTTVVKTHPFFDGSQGSVYNLQSAIRIASPAIMFIGAVLACWTYKAFSSYLLSGTGGGGGERDEEGGSIIGGGGTNDNVSYYG